MKKMKLLNGKYTIMDDADFEKFGKLKWNSYEIGGTYYVRRGNIYLHREIMNNKKEKLVDHKNGNGLDNRKSNLRICTKQQNVWNHRKHKDNTSGYSGVNWFKPVKKWRAYINIMRKQTNLGYFDDIKDAVKARKLAELKYFGEFARTTH